MKITKKHAQTRNDNLIIYEEVERNQKRFKEGKDNYKKWGQNARRIHSIRWIMK